MVKDVPHGVHDEREDRIERKERGYGEMEQQAAADLVRQPVVTQHEHRRRGHNGIHLTNTRQRTHAHVRLLRQPGYSLRVGEGDKTRALRWLLIGRREEVTGNLRVYGL